MSGMTSTGRGGAGNIAEATKSSRITTADLETPTLKTPVVTTGRGGSGNMAPNLDPVETRARQDVGPVERRPSTGAIHVGRGGAANVVKPNPPEVVPDVPEGGTAAVTDTAATATTAATTAAGAAADAGTNVPVGKLDIDGGKDRGLAKKAKDFFKRT
ncbi:hypothetical protein F4861DRAFT_243795 [Xylaria intraflava]|nr:hypothetical protein F4861DRAFT_243795 [Xylaria intraflava]